MHSGYTQCMTNTAMRYADSITTGFKKGPVDRDSVRNFVYTLSDADGAPVYVGRSSNVAARIKAHISNATNPHDKDAAFTAGWLRDVRSVSMVGPFNWDDAVAEERRQIKTKMPRGNRCGVPKYLAPGR
jgi:predicted GIY-YIG superfamily endonuclease